jgi:uncharacterized protein (TIGR03382 family)
VSLSATRFVGEEELLRLEALFAAIALAAPGPVLAQCRFPEDVLCRHTARTLAEGRILQIVPTNEINGRNTTIAILKTFGEPLPGLDEEAKIFFDGNLVIPLRGFAAEENISFDGNFAIPSGTPRVLVFVQPDLTAEDMLAVDDNDFVEAFAHELSVDDAAAAYLSADCFSAVQRAAPGATGFHGCNDEVGCQSVGGPSTLGAGLLAAFLALGPQRRRRGAQT